MIGSTRLILVRHGETVYNAAARFQGNDTHTPLSRRGLLQAQAMARALAASLRGRDDIDLWAAPTGRALQTAAIIAERLRVDFFSVRTDPRLVEIDIGDWRGRTYEAVVAEIGPILCPVTDLLTVRPPGGEGYGDVRRRLALWLSDLPPDRTALTVSHGMTLRVLRGMFEDGVVIDDVNIGSDTPQGLAVCMPRHV